MRSKKTIPAILLLAVFYSQAAGAEPSQTQADTEGEDAVLVGVAKVDATPAGPVVLAGYGGRTTEHEGIDTRLWARAMVIGDRQPAVLVVLDNCGIPANVTARLAERLARHAVTPERLVVAATHTHNAPTLVGYARVVWAGRTTPDQDRHVQEYTTLAIEKMEQAVVAALAAREPMQLSWAQGRVTFGGNRRVLNDGKWAGFGFQRDGPIDHSLPVLAARDATGKVRAVWANYACHCTTVGSRNRVGGDWAGFANTLIEKEFPAAVSLMTIGCGADIGPQPSGNLEIASQHGLAIATEAQRLLAGETLPLRQAPRVIARRIKLPLSEPPPRAYWDAQLREPGFHHQLARAMLTRLADKGTLPRDVEYPLSAWTFGEDLALVFLAGEVVVDYSVRLNRELDWSRLGITAWANAMPGYIPSRRVLAEGGYEPDFSQVYYEQPARYAPEVEDRLVAAVKELVGPKFVADTNQEPAPFHKIPSGEQPTFRRVARWAAADKSEEEEAILQRVRHFARHATPAIGRHDDRDGHETHWFNFAGDFVRRRFIRQQAKGTELQWQTPRIKRAPGQVTLCFTGGIGWQSQPSNQGFGLLVDGVERVTFDVSRQPVRWSSEDDTVELVYLPTWTSDEDSAGFFFLRLPAPRNDLAFDIAIRSLGEGSNRWFAIDAQQDVQAKLKLLAEALGSND